MCDAAQDCVAVGFFDGVHLGHQAILRGATSAITFSNHPLSVLAPERAPRLIMSLEDRLAAIRGCGVKKVVAIEFDEVLAQESPREFMNRIGPCVRCGENWRFGAEGAGNAAFLRAYGVDVQVVPYAEYKGKRISSTRIRMALETGAVTDANAMLGRPFSAFGTVFFGKGEGRTFGFPTVNLHLEIALRMPFGVYAVEVDGCRAIANYGVAPTMGERAWNVPCLEIHFLDGVKPRSVEGMRLGVLFFDLIRPERKFGSVEELAKQIARDVAFVGSAK